MWWISELVTWRPGFTSVWKVLLSPPWRSCNAISIMRSFCLLSPVVSISKTITVTSLAMSSFSAIFCWISQYWFLWKSLTSVFFRFNVDLVETVLSRISCPMVVDLLFRVVWLSPPVLVLTGLLIHLLLYPPSTPLALEPSNRKLEFLPRVLFKLRELSHQKLAKVWILHLGTCKIEKHIRTVLMQLMNYNWARFQRYILHHKCNLLRPENEEWIELMKQYHSELNLWHFE